MDKFVCPRTGRVFSAYKTTAQAILQRHNINAKSAMICSECGRPVRVHQSSTQN